MYPLIMNIKAFIDSSSNKTEARRNLAALLDVEEVTVRSWANGNRHPNRKIWKKIVEATEGAITIADLADPTHEHQAQSTGKTHVR